MINDKCDQESVDKIINIGYPDNTEHLDDLLAWTCDPNWPIAGTIYNYFRSLGALEVSRVLQTASAADNDWRYTLIIQIIASYDNESLTACTEHLVRWAKQTGSDECDFESLRLLSEHDLVDHKIIADITKRNLFVYNLWIKETLDATSKSIYKFPFKDHTL